MDRAEVRARLQQEVSKRRDGLFSLTGFDFTPKLRSARQGASANFFFSPHSVDPILSLLKQRLPRQVDLIVQLAEKICRHQFDLLGYENLDYGSPIQWQLDVVHGKRPRPDVFYKVRYLDFHAVGDSKVTWELNRHQHFLTLAKAYRLTGNTRFADEVLRQWRDWWSANRYPKGINWASSLEVAFRSLAWLWTLHLLDSPGVPNFRAEWLRGLGLHGRHIEQYLSTYFSPNTHLLGEGVGLFFLGTLCPELEDAERWKSLGWKIVLSEAANQVQSDGFHFEQSTYYHVYALDLFLHSAVLASANNIPIPSSFEDALEKMLNALCLLGRWGLPPRFGDDDGGRLFDPRRNRSEHLLDPLAAGAILFQRGDFKAAAGTLTEEAIWLLGVEGVRRWDELEASPPTSDSAALPAAGFYMLTAPQQSAQLVIDAGPQGTQSGGHGHADALSVTLQSHGRALLIDPGTCEYIGQGDKRDVFRGSASHNTLRVDGVDQSETNTPFSWKRLTQSKVEKWIQGKNFDLLVASHDGYQRLAQPAIHQRWVVSLKNGMYLVRDVVAGEGKHQLDVSWHLSHDLQMIRENLYRIKGASQGLALLPAAQTPAWTEEVRKQQWSPAYGQTAPMNVLNFGVKTALPAEFAVLLVTLEEVHAVPGRFSRDGNLSHASDVRTYRYESAESECSFFFGSSNEPWRQDWISSDAEFVCIKRTPEGRLTLILCDGSYAAVSDGPALRFKRKVQWGEVILFDRNREVFSSDPDSLENEEKDEPAAPETNRAPEVSS